MRQRALMILFGLSLATLGLALPGAALGSAASEQKQGASALRGFDRGGKHCSSLTRSDLDHIGEYLMGRMVGSSSAHDAMDDLMERMMGTEATEQMHVALGQRSTGCGSGEAPRSFQSMMGAVGMMGLGPLSGKASRSSGIGSMMGGNGRGFGGMMGRSYGSGGDDDTDGVEIAILVMLGVLIALAITALWLWRQQRRRGSGSALDILNERFAHGELDAEDYERRRRMLEGPGANST